MTADLGDLTRVLQADVLPTAPGIGRLVDAIADRDIDADGGFARSRVDDVGVSRRHFQRANRRSGQVAIADVLPVLPGISGLPDAAADAAEVEGVLIARIAGDSDDASAAEGSDTAEFG